MKKIILPMFTLLLFSLSSCNSDDDTNDTTIPILQHKWTLISSGGGFAGTTYNFEEGVITWKFNADGTVNVVNNNQEENKPDSFDSGTYDYEVVNNNNETEDCNKSMDVDTATFYCYNIDAQGRLILDDSPVDGIKMTFVLAD